MTHPDMKSNPLYHNQSPAIKKDTLKDMQNDDRSILDKKPNGDVVKGSGSKRLSPHQRTLISNDLNDDLANVRRRFEAELGKSRIRDNWDKNTTYLQPRSNAYNKKQDLPQETQTKVTKSDVTNTKVANTKVTNPSHALAASPNSMASGMVSPKVVGPSDPVPLCKPGNFESNGIKVKKEFCPANTEVTNKWQERFVGLHKFLNLCDDAASRREYAQGMLLLPPSEINKHAVDLENRANQLIIDEGKEVQRVKALDILGKERTKNILHKNSVLASKDRR